MRRLGHGILYAIGGYFLGAAIGYPLVQLLSGNSHDLQLEAVMTAAFVAGPLAAVVAGVVGAVRAGRSSRSARPAG